MVAFGCFADARSQCVCVALINTEAVRHRSIELIITATISMIEVSSLESSGQTQLLKG